MHAAAPHPLFVVSAYACAPGFGSERGVGWAWANAYAAIGPTLVISYRHSANSGAVDGSTPRHNGLSVRQLTTVFDWLPDRHVFVYLKYLTWVFVAQREIRSLEREGRIRLCHHVTFASDSLPAPRPRDLQTYIWGPVGGSSRTPKDLRCFLSRRSRLLEYFRALTNRGLQRWWSRAVIRDARLLLAQNADTEVRFRELGAQRVHVFPNAVVPPEFVVQAGSRRRPGTKHYVDVVYVGRLLDWKGVHIALSAIARCNRPVHFSIYGAGPFENRLRSLSDSLGVSDCVAFRGEVPRSEIAAAFRDSDALLFPSFHDACGWAVAEAAVSGLPVVCFDAAGPPHVCGDNGIFIDMSDPVIDLARILRSLADGKIATVPDANVDFTARRVESFARALASRLER